MTLVDHSIAGVIAAMDARYDQSSSSGLCYQQRFCHEWDRSHQGDQPEIQSLPRRCLDHRPSFECEYCHSWWDAIPRLEQHRIPAWMRASFDWFIRGNRGQKDKPESSAGDIYLTNVNERSDQRRPHLSPWIVGREGDLTVPGKKSYLATVEEFHSINVRRSSNLTQRASQDLLQIVLPWVWFPTLRCID